VLLAQIRDKFAAEQPAEAKPEETLPSSLPGVDSGVVDDRVAELMARLNRVDADLVLREPEPEPEQAEPSVARRLDLHEAGALERGAWRVLHATGVLARLPRLRAVFNAWRRHCAWCTGLGLGGAEEEEAVREARAVPDVSLDDLSSVLEQMTTQVNSLSLSSTLSAAKSRSQAPGSPPPEQEPPERGSRHARETTRSWDVATRGHVDFFTSRLSPSRAAHTPEPEPEPEPQEPPDPPEPERPLPDARSPRSPEPAQIVQPPPAAPPERDAQGGRDSHGRRELPSGGASSRGPGGLSALHEQLVQASAATQRRHAQRMAAMGEARAEAGKLRALAERLSP